MIAVGYKTRVDWRGKQVQQVVARRALDAIESAGDELLRKANETIPFEDGTLAASGQVDVNAATLTAQVSYSTPYAIRQHEDTSLRHPNPMSPKSSPNGRARWLELTAKEQKARLARWVQQQMKGAR